MNIQLINPFNGQKLTKTAQGLVDEEGKVFPLVNGAYRIVPSENYADSFSFQWKLFNTTQIDKHSKLSLTKTRFFLATKWEEGGLDGENILEVGCGAGRFTQIVLDNTKATLHSFDYSRSVEANYENNGPNSRLHLYQASVYEMPFAEDSFDKVFCFGTLQFTPDFKKSIEAMIKVLKPGGELVVDCFVKRWYTKLSAKYLVRPFTRRMDHEKLYNLIARNVGWMVKVSRFLHKIKLGTLSRLLPLCDIENVIPKELPKEAFRKWVILDTFNMLSPAYDNPQPAKKIIKWFKELGMKEVEGGIKTYGSGNTITVVKGVK